ncbi:uncharacterized protein DS421_13g406360 [Arachis hypogaea]|nr:uncharacterized protein DS421_13g406360 [Arachis hypogaea]
MEKREPRHTSFIANPPKLAREKRRKGRCLAPSPACLGAVAASLPSTKLGGCCPCQKRERRRRDDAGWFRRPCCRAVRICRHGRRSSRLSFCHLRPCCRRRKSMPSPSPELGCRSRWRWLPGLPPNQFRGRYCFVFVLHVAVVIAKVAAS